MQISLPKFTFFTIKSPSLLKDRFLEKMLFRKTIGLNNYLNLFQNNFKFLDNEVWIKGATIFFGIGGS